MSAQLYSARLIFLGLSGKKIVADLEAGLVARALIPTTTCGAGIRQPQSRNDRPRGLGLLEMHGSTTLFDPFQELVKLS